MINFSLEDWLLLLVRFVQGVGWFLLAVWALNRTGLAYKRNGWDGVRRWLARYLEFVPVAGLALYYGTSFLFWGYSTDTIRTIITGILLAFYTLIRVNSLLKSQSEKHETPVVVIDGKLYAEVKPEDFPTNRIRKAQVIHNMAGD